MKKILIAIITTILLFTTYTSCYASSSLSSPSNYIKDEVTNDSTPDPNFSQNILNQYNSGEVPYGDTKLEIPIQTSGNVVVEIIAFVITLIPHSIQALMSIAIMPDIPSPEVHYFTIESLLSGEIDLFDINIFDVSDSNSNVNRIIKENVAKWFFALRNFAIIALLAVLIYIGILMAISSTSQDKAKYKHMLTSWFVSFALLFVIQYVLIIAINVSNEFMDIILTVSESMESQKNFENTESALIFGYVKENGEKSPGMLSNVQTMTGWTRLALVAVYCVLVYYQVKFFFMYIKRFFMVGFLTAISPLITITYSIDKAGDNKAQAYKAWFTEIMVNIFIQPIHLLFFLIFMRSTQEIIFRVPIFGIILIGTLSRAEMIVKKLFKLNSNSLGGIGRKGK